MILGERARPFDAEGHDNDGSECPGPHDMNRRRCLHALLALGGAPGLVAARPSASATWTRATFTHRTAIVLGSSMRQAVDAAEGIAVANAREVASALSRLAFAVHLGIDEEPGAIRQALKASAESAAAAQGCSLIVVYFSGLGFQLSGENYLLPARLQRECTARELIPQSINVHREIPPLSRLDARTTVVLVADAFAPDASSPGIDWNFTQMDPPRYTAIAYSAAAGSAAPQPQPGARNSIYTATLVQTLLAAGDVLTIRDCLDYVKYRVRYVTEITTNGKYQRPQDPEVAAYLPDDAVPAEIDARYSSGSDAEAWARIVRTMWPVERVKLLRDFVVDYPASRLRLAAQAHLARSLLAETPARFHHSAVDFSIGSADFQFDQLEAIGGDKDAAYRVARAYRHGLERVPVNAFRALQWFQRSSDLGNGIASYELSLYYGGVRSEALASRYEKRARALGYTAPPAPADT